MIYCAHCGVTNRDGSRYCNACGSLLVENQESPPIPEWLKDAAYTNYLWKGDAVLPEWLVDLPQESSLDVQDGPDLPPNPIQVPPDLPSAPQSGAVDTDVEFQDFVIFDEEDAPESELLMLDDLESETDDQQVEDNRSHE